MQTINKIAFLAVGTLAAVANAQDPSSFPTCAQWCITSMQQSNKSQELGCTPGDNGCLCRNANFTYGVRDCSAELCADTTPAEMALGYVNNFCQEQGVQLSTVTSGLPASFTSDAGNSTGSASTVQVTSTVQFTSTITTDGSTITTTGVSTISPVASASQVLSTIVSDGSTFVSTISSKVASATSQVGSLTSQVGSLTSQIGSITSSLGTNTAQETATSTSQGFAAQITAAPGRILAVAGVAAFLL